MSLLVSIKRLVRRTFAGFPEHYVTRLGVVVAVPDPTTEETGTDRFRPRYAVDVELLTPLGEPDPDWPILEGLALPTFAGLYAFPEPGTRVRIGFDFGLPSHPHIRDVLSEGRPAPALRPGERLWQHSAEAFQRFDAKGNLTIQTNGELREDSSLRTILADEVAETLGKVGQTVKRDLQQNINGRLIQQVLGAIVQTCAGDVRRAILGGVDTAIAGDESRLVGGDLETVAAGDAKLQAATGDVLIEAVLGSAEFKSAVKNSITSALVDIGISPTDALLISSQLLLWLDAHTHPVSGGTALATNTPTGAWPLPLLSAVGKTK